MAIAEDEFDLLDPTTGPVAQGALSPRLDSLSGKTIGVIWNGRQAGDEIFRRMTDILKAEHGVKEVVFRAKTFVGNIAPAEIFDDLSGRCDAVMTGVGD